MFTINLAITTKLNNRPMTMHISDRKHSLVDVCSYRVSERHRSEHDCDRCHIE